MNIVVNGEAREVPDLTRLSEIVGSPASRGIAVAVDGVVVPRARHDDTELTDGARVEIVTAVQGG